MSDLTPINPLETVASMLPPGQATRDFMTEARRAAALVEDIDAKWLAGEIDDVERATLIRTMRGTADPQERHATAREALVRALVPERFRGVTLASYRPRTASQDLARRAVQRFLERVRGGESTMLALIGSQGVGKSHLAYAALQDLIAEYAGQRAIYARGWYALADELRYGGKSPYTGVTMESHDLRALLWAGRIVLLDEVRLTAGTDFDDRELAKWACHAHDNGVSAIVTTNIAPLAQAMGPAAASRFHQVEIVGPDARQERRDHKAAAAGDR